MLTLGLLTSSSPKSKIPNSNSQIQGKVNLNVDSGKSLKSYGPFSSSSSSSSLSLTSTRHTSPAETRSSGLTRPTPGPPRASRTWWAWRRKYVFWEKSRVATYHRVLLRTFSPLKLYNILSWEKTDSLMLTSRIKTIHLDISVWYYISNLLSWKISRQALKRTSPLRFTTGKSLVKQWE